MKTLLASLILALIPLGATGAGERFACNMKAMTKSERATYAELADALRGAVLETRELPNGYGFRLPASALGTAAEWVALERKCCPFFTFTINVGRDAGPVWLEVKGSEGVKTFIRSEFGL
jgi:hypothetical protein